MSFQPLLEVLSQSVAVAGIARVSKASGAQRQSSGTIDLASKVSGLKGSPRTLLLSEPCISTSGVAMATVRCTRKMGIMGRKASTILSPCPWLYYFGRNLYYYENSWRTPEGPGTPLKIGPVRIAWWACQARDQSLMLGREWKQSQALFPRST